MELHHPHRESPKSRASLNDVLKNALSKFVTDHISYPLHMVISSGAPKRVLEILIKEAPEVASKTDKFRQNCLNLAVKNEGTSEPYQENHRILDAVKLFHSLDKSQAKTSDKTSQLPLHTACEVGCSIDVAILLVRAYPESAHILNLPKGRIKMEIAR